MRYPQAFCQQQLQLVAQPLAPMAQVRAFVRKLVLEKLLSGEVLEIRVMTATKKDRSIPKRQPRQGSSTIADLPTPRSVAGSPHPCIRLVVY